MSERAAVRHRHMRAPGQVCLVLALVALLQACGRVAFEPVTLGSDAGAVADTPDAEPSGWRTAGRLPRPSWMSCGAIFEDRLYIAGGQEMSERFVDTAFAPLLPDGTLGSWVPSTPLPVPLKWHECIIDAPTRTFYVLGGDPGTAAATTTVYRATIAADGGLGAWMTSAALPEGRRGHGVAIGAGSVLVVGGEASDGFMVRDTILAATINPDGSLGAWASAGTLPNADYEHGVASERGRLYLTGGYTGIDAVFVAPIGGAFVTTTVLPQPRQRHAALALAGYLYVIGGSDMYMGMRLGDVWRAPILFDGALGTWEQLDALPGPPRAFMIGAVSDRRLYIAGGDDDTRQLDDVFVLTPPP